jgi:hypothetical protein
MAASGRTMERLTRWLVLLTVALILLGVATIIWG